MMTGSQRLRQDALTEACMPLLYCSQASQRMAEQLVMLETAFVRRDHEVSKAKQLENTLVRMV
jgi:hypothetical protein